MQNSSFEIPLRRPAHGGAQKPHVAELIGERHAKASRGCGAGQNNHTLRLENTSNLVSEASLENKSLWGLPVYSRTDQVQGVVRVACALARRSAA